MGWGINYFVQDTAVVTLSTAENQEIKTEFERISTWRCWKPLLSLSLVLKETLCGKEVGRNGWQLGVISHTVGTWFIAGSHFSPGRRIHAVKQMTGGLSLTAVW